jgi:uncharacterized damage-inducible protein DinB
MKAFFKDIFEYTFRYNEMVLNLLLKEGITIPDKSLKLINHTLNAQEIWNARIEGWLPTVNVWDVRPSDALKAVNEKNYHESLRILDEFELDTKIEYANSRGEVFVNTVGEILFHAVNHSTYHRGQIATDCKEHDIAPLVTDYIFYKRENF